MVDRDEALAVYRAEVLRWNRQINLVSRVSTERRLEALIRQCRAAWAVLAAHEPELVAGTRLRYDDLGAGGGLPGLIWLSEMNHAAVPVAACLVEPREKRAWFLERTARLMGLDNCRVAAARWGAAAPGPPSGAGQALISLKALRLTDPEILAGLAAAQDGTPAARVCIVRFHAGGTRWDRKLATELEAAPAGGGFTASGHAWTNARHRVLAVPAGDHPDTCLVVARYDLREPCST